jgi:hypothetical protein
MRKERIIIEFDDWADTRPIDEIVELEVAIKEGDYGRVAEVLRVYDADDIRIEREKIEGWEEKE